MRRINVLIGFCAFVLLLNSAAAAPDEQLAAVQHWYTELGPPRPHEGFADFVVRAAEQQIGRPYVNPPQEIAQESLQIEVLSFQCVSLIESSLSIARCAWQKTPTIPCFAAELTAWRYRNGQLKNYDSRLHYYYDWLNDNAKRGRLDLITEQLGGRPQHFEFNYMTRHVKNYPALSDKSLFHAMQQREKELSRVPLPFIAKDQVAAISPQLANGDVIGVVVNKPGMVIGHTGLVVRDYQGTPHLLHASSYHERVVLTRADLASYMMAEKNRLGIFIARPRAP